MVGFAVLLMALGLTLTLSRSGILALLVALVVSSWFVARRQPMAPQRAIVGAYLIFVALVAVGWTGFARLTARFAIVEAIGLADRPNIWADTWHLAGRFPISGTGLDTFGTAMLVYQTTDRRQHLAEAHNDYLQLLAEGGALVCVPAALALFAFACVVHRRLRISDGNSDDWIRIGAVTGILAIALQETADFSLQMPGNAALLVVLLSVAVRDSSRHATRQGLMRGGS